MSKERMQGRKIQTEGKGKKKRMEEGMNGMKERQEKTKKIKETTDNQLL